MTDRLWAPWRIGLLVGEKPPGCFLCEAAADPSKDEESLVLDRAERCFVIMNRFPYSNGHLLIAPLAHEGDYATLDEATLDDIGRVSRLWIRVVREAMQPNGFNMGWNLGKAGGAGVADHLHMHVVPRWVGDHNFMSICSDTHVISQSLAEAWRELRAARLRA